MKDWGLNNHNSKTVRRLVSYHIPFASQTPATANYENCRHGAEVGSLTKDRYSASYLYAACKNTVSSQKSPHSRIWTGY